MKLFGLEIKRTSQTIIPQVEIVQDVVPEITETVPIDSKKPTTIPSIPDPVLRYRHTRFSGRGAFTGSEYDMAEVGRIEDTDSYARQSFDKKTALMFKEGWDLIGANPRTIKYVKARFAQLARASNLATDQLLRQLGSSLIRKSNSFVIKVRKTAASGGAVRKDLLSKKTLQPVAAYFPAPAETMQYQLDNNKIVKWRQMMPDGSYVEHEPENVIHIYYDRKDGFIFGTPTIVPVVDDIRALRKIEENIELLLYQHLFPLFQYKVGTKEQPCGLTENGESEIAVVRREIQFMPSEGGIVTPERHEILAIGSEGRAIRAEGYLEHFKKRVFSGLGVSAVDMGEGETANRACYSEDTETLTDSGFKYYWEITKQDKIATYNSETNRIEFQYPNGNILLYPYKGKMLEFKNRNIDILVTPDHDIWMGRPKNDQELNWEKIHASDINIHQFKFKTGGLLWEGLEPEDFQLPHIPYSCYSNVPNSGSFARILISDWLEFLGYYVSEGCLVKANGKWAVTLSQNSVVNYKKTEKIRDCLSRLPFKFNEYTDPEDNTTRFWINCKSLYLYLEECCGDYSYLKHFPDEILGYDVNALRIVFEAAMTGDGTVDLRSGRSSRTYYSTSDKLLDQIQEIALKLGYRAHILPGSKCGRVCVSSGPESNVIRDQISTQDYDGMVYCFNVPNHLFITRRNGRIGIHGNTADNMSRNMIDAVKDLQNVLETFLNIYMIEELLLESTFGPTVLDDDMIVKIRFKEVDISEQIKRESHAADQFTKNLISHDEARQYVGYQPVHIPSKEEMEAADTPEKLFPTWYRMYWKLFDEPKTLLQSKMDPFSPSALAAMDHPHTEVSKENAEEAIATKTKHEKELVKAGGQNKPKLQASPRKQDGYLVNTYDALVQDIITTISNDNKINHEWIGQLIHTGMGTAISRLVSSQVLSFKNGYKGILSTNNPQFVQSVATARSLFNERANYYVDKLARNMVSALRRNVSQYDTPQELVLKTRATLDALKFRSSFIEDVEIRRAETWGKVQAWKATGSQYIQSVFTHEDACDNCKEISSNLIKLTDLTLDNVPPYHAFCRCHLVVQIIQDAFLSSNQKDSIMTAEEEDSKQSEFVKCVQKNKLRLRVSHPKWSEDQLEMVAVAACSHNLSAPDNAEMDDKTKIDSCVSRVKAQLRKDHPKWDDERINSSAYAICNTSIKGE